jgi:hypothetical protein
VIGRLLSFVSIACCAFVFVSFALFANDQLAGASKHQQNALGASTAQVTTAPARSAAPHRASPRHYIDLVAGDLTSPFESLVHSNNDWVKHGLPAAVALLVYGLGLSMLARYAQSVHV